jgi:hypothetical protein
LSASWRNNGEFFDGSGVFHGPSLNARHALSYASVRAAGSSSLAAVSITRIDRHLPCQNRQV